MLLTILINKITFVLTVKNVEDVSTIESKLKFSLKQIKKFYKIYPEKVYLHLIYSREEMNKKVGRKTEDWFVGFAEKNVINLMSPNIIEKYSSHSQEYFDKLLTHELVHIFNSLINDNPLMWVDEGLALNIAGQNKKNKIIKKDWDYFINNNGILGKISYQNFAEHSGYIISYWAIYALLNDFKKDECMKLLKINPKINNVDTEIKKILNMSSDQVCLLIKKRLDLF